MRPVSVQVRRLMTQEEKEHYEAMFEIGRFLEQAGRFDYAAVLQKEVDRIAQPAVERMLRYEHRPANKGSMGEDGEVPEPVVMQAGKVVNEEDTDEDE